MTKRNLLVSLFLVLGLVVMTTSALATVWTVGANVNSSGRSESFAEAAGQVTVSIVNGGPVGAGAYFTFNYSPASIVPGTVQVSCSGGAGSPWAGGCANLNLPSVSGSGVSISFSAGTTFTTGDGSEIIVTVRLNANAIGAGKTLNCVVTAHPPGGNGPVFSLVNTSTQTVGPVLVVNPFPSLSLGFGSMWGDKIGVAAGVLTCLGTKPIGNYKDKFVLNVDENFSAALTSESYELTADPGSTSPGLVTNGSNFVVTFSNVPTGLGIEAGDPVPCSSLDTANPLQCNTDTASGTLTVAFEGSKTGNGTAAFFYEVTSMDNYGATGMLENVSLPFRFKSWGPLAPGLPAMLANVNYYPTTLPAIPYFTGTAELAKGLVVVNFYDCVTNLLFPYINTFTAGGTAPFSNFGTGVVLANTTADPFGLNPYTAKGSAVAESGSCTLYLYPQDLTGPYTITTPTIQSGGTAVFDVASAGPALGYTVAPAAFKNKQGYGIAICNFENGYGYAEIYDNYGLAGAPSATLAYLAYIIPNPTLYPRSPAGDGLGASAIAPIDFDKAFKKLLMYGKIEGGR